MAGWRGERLAYPAPCCVDLSAPVSKYLQRSRLPLSGAGLGAVRTSGVAIRERS